jgi:hypothetical protein
MDAARVAQRQLLLDWPIIACGYRAISAHVWVQFLVTFGRKAHDRPAISAIRNVTANFVPDNIAYNSP